MTRLTLLLACCVASATHYALADDAAAMAALRAGCAADAQRLCAGVQSGGGRILACLKEHKDKVSDSCKVAIVKATQQPPPN